MANTVKIKLNTANMVSIPIEPREDEDLRECPYCGNLVPRVDMSFTYDCHGIPFRLVCYDCYEKLMEKGYDGEYYTEADECIDWDY